MASTYWSGQRYAPDPNLGIMAPQAQGLDSLDAFLEQALDPSKTASGLDLGKYMEGVNIAPGGLGNQAAIDQNIGSANTILSRLYASDPSLFRGGQFNPWSSFADWNARQNQREGFNEGAGLGDFIGSIPGELFRVGGELASERGVQALALAAAGGSMLGGGAAAPAAAPAGGAAGGTGITTGARGVTGLTQGAAGASGLAAAPAAGTALAPGFFAAESLAPTGGASGGPPPAGGAGAGITLSQIAAGAIPAAFGAFGANQQANQYGALANQYMAMGAPYRSRLSDLYSDPEDWLNSPEVQIPVQQGTNILARSLSTKGNPTGSGNALQELQNYASKQLFDRLGSEKDRLAGFGGLSAYNSAAPSAANAQIGAQKGIYDAIGAGAADIFNPPRRYNLQDLLRGY